MNLAYDQRHMHTPNFDAIAQKGMTFTHAYCQIAVCAPSRCGAFLAACQFAHSVDIPVPCPTLCHHVQRGYPSTGGVTSFSLAAA